MSTKILISLAALATAAMPLAAHHAFAAEYNDKKPVKLVGKVTGMEWINPHAWVHLDVTVADNKVEHWMVECGSPNIMLRRGFTKTSLPLGTEIVVDGYQARAHTLLRANGRNVTFPDGRKLFLGSSNPDLPKEEGSDKDSKAK